MNSCFPSRPRKRRGKKSRHREITRNKTKFSFFFFRRFYDGHPRYCSSEEQLQLLVSSTRKETWNIIIRLAPRPSGTPLRGTVTNMMGAEGNPAKEKICRQQWYYKRNVAKIKVLRSRIPFKKTAGKLSSNEQLDSPVGSAIFFTPHLCPHERYDEQSSLRFLPSKRFQL